jgi:hypothetical protein
VRGRLTPDLVLQTGSGVVKLCGFGELLEELDLVRDEVPANSEAWDRLLRQVRDEAGPLASARRTA